MSSPQGRATTAAASRAVLAENGPEAGSCDPSRFARSRHQTVRGPLCRLRALLAWRFRAGGDGLLVPEHSSPCRSAAGQSCCALLLSRAEAGLADWPEPGQRRKRHGCPSRQGVGVRKVAGLGPPPSELRGHAGRPASRCKAWSWPSHPCSTSRRCPSGLRVGCET